MQFTTNQTVPATSSVPSQTADRQPATFNSAPVPLSDDMLRQIAGGIGPGSDAPKGSW